MGRMRCSQYTMRRSCLQNKINKNDNEGKGEVKDEFDFTGKV